MRKLLKLFFVGCCLFSTAYVFADSAAYVFAEPNFNLSLNKKTLRIYHDSGTYDKQIAEMIANAEKYLNERLSQAPVNSHKMAIVYDIDETSLSNYSRMLENDFGGPPSYVAETVKGDSAVPILPTRALYRKAHAKGIAQFFITGRYENLRETTIRNLKRLGYADWQGLYLEPTGSHYKTAADFKAQIRKKLIEAGYDIVLNIGDQCSDLADSKPLATPASKQIQLPAVCGGQVGAYEDHAIKLPNPYYFAD